MKVLFFVCICVYGGTLFGSNFSDVKGLDEYLQKLEEDAKNGDVESQYSIGFMYEHLGEKDQAIECYKTAIGKRHMEAQYRLGLIYYYAETYDGFPVIELWEQVFDIFYDLAQRGHNRSQLILARIYMKGDCFMPKDLCEGVKWITIAIEDEQESSKYLYDNYPIIYSNTNAYKEGIRRAEEWKNFHCKPG